MMSAQKDRSSFFIVWTALAIAATACNEEGSEPSSVTTEEQAVMVEGSINYLGESVSDIEVTFVAGNGSGELDNVAVTDDNGRFSITLPEAGSYLVLTELKDETGIFSAVLDGVDIDENTSELEPIGLVYYNLDDQMSEELGTAEQALGVGIGCLRAGCSRGIRCYGSMRCVCCGYNVCIAGWEVCVPYGRW